ncbi:hypothetical protein HBH94_068820 [Parastagonospora nodorum]|nr:hypothetical protein HBH94_068820 [Parastagonospora nodorum]KAH5259702.1 hypothetical protein HBI71_113170 [Parastagonospora nodorum]KAH5739744.1 hypothetical protein HBI20_003490 [Parastagonospora nodorum]
MHAAAIVPSRKFASSNSVCHLRFWGLSSMMEPGAFATGCGFCVGWRIFLDDLGGCAVHACFVAAKYL